MSMTAAVLGASIGDMNEAQALTVQDIIIMHAQGVPESVLVSVIQNAQNLDKLEKSDYDKLKEQGVSPKVMAEISMRIKALDKDKSSQSDGQDKDIASAASDTANASDTIADEKDSSNEAKIEQDAQTKTASEQNTQLDTEPEQNSQARTGTSVEQNTQIETVTEQNSQARTGTSSEEDSQTAIGQSSLIPAEDTSVEAPHIVQGTVLSPIETSNAVIVLDKFFEELDNTYRIESEMARRYAALREETGALEDAMSELPTVAQYRREIGEGEPIRALDSCMSMLGDIAPGANTALGAALRQCIGEALGALGAYGMGAAYLDEHGTATHCRTRR